MVLQVADQPTQARHVVIGHAKRDVALCAEQAADALPTDAAPATPAPGARAARVVVVDHQPRAVDAAGALRHTSAGRAESALSLDHAAVVGQPDPVERPELCVQPAVRRVNAMGFGPVVGARSAVPAGPLAVADALDHCRIASGARLHAHQSTAKLPATEFGVSDVEAS